MSRRMTLEQVEKMQPHSAAATRNLLHDDDLADEIEEMTPEEFADWRGIEIIENPPPKGKQKGALTMATIRELRAKLREKDEIISDLESENDEMRDTLAEIRGLASEDDDDDSDEPEDEEESEDE